MREDRDAAADFEAFQNGWLTRQERLLDDLLCSMEVDAERILPDLIGSVLVHFREYYEAKSRVIERDVFVLFAPGWLSPLERTYLWITGFKPGIVFRIVNRVVADQTEHQSRSLERLKREVTTEEEELAAEIAWVQNSAVVAPLLTGARRLAVNGEVAAQERAISYLESSLERLVRRADGLRMKAVVRVVQILNSVQGVQFLAALMHFQLRSRASGHRGGAAAAGTIG